MPVEEKVIISCSCLAQYNVAKLKPGAKFKCQKCGNVNVVPEFQEEVIEEPPPLPPPPPPRPLARAPIKKELPKTTLARSKTPKLPLRNKPVATEEMENGEEEAYAEKPTMISKLMSNKKYLFIGGGVLIVLLGAFYVFYSNAQTAKMKEIAGRAEKLLDEINELQSKQSFSEALDKYELYVKEFKQYNLPGFVKIEKNIENLKKLIEKETAGKEKLAELLKKKESASPDKYPELLKEFERFINNNSDLLALISKAEPEAKDLQVKVAAAEKEVDDKVFKEMIAEVTPLRDKEDYDGAIAKLKDLYEKYPNKTVGLQKRVKNALNELAREKKETK
jgi:hypothetical protein